MKWLRTLMKVGPVARMWVALMLGLVLMSSNSAFAAASVLDQLQLITTDMDVDVSSAVPMAQTFKPGVSGILEKVSLPLYKLGEIGCDNRQVTLQIKAGTPDGSGAVLGSGIVTVTSAYNAVTWYDLVLSPQPVLQKDQVYSMIVSAPTSANSGLAYKWANVYPRGEMWVFAPHQRWEMWTGADDSDFAFKTWMVPLSSNANLGYLGISSGSLSPAFAAGTMSYTASVPYTTTTLGVTPTVADSTATMRVNGSVAASGSTTSVPLSVGVTTIPVSVTAQDGETSKYYTVTVTRAAPSTNANLSGLTLTSGTLTPAFTSGTTAYTAIVGHAVTSLNITPTVTDSTATLTVNGSLVASGSPANVSLNVGTNTITVVVTAQDGTTQKTYTVTVTRLSNNANLSGLSLTAGAISPAFAAGTTSYTVSVAYAVSSLGVTPTVADPTASLQVNGSAATSGSETTLPLAVGANPVTIVVTAQDGTTKTYSLTVTRVAASTDANLSSLAFSAGTLSPAFASGTKEYSLSLPGHVRSLTVTPTTADSHATVTVDGSTVASGSGSAVAISAAGPTTITVAVTAEDGITTATYTITAWPGPLYTASSANTAQLASVGSVLTALQVSALPGADLTFTLTGGSLPPGIILNTDGTFTGVVTTVGVSSANIQVADTHGGVAMTTLAVTVQAAPAFTGAVVNTSQLISTSAGVAALQATAATGETLTFSLIGGSLPAGITLNADGTFSGVAITAGSSSATIRAADTHGGVASTTLDVTVQQGPAFTGSTANTNQLVSVGHGLADLDATAAAGETLTFTLAGGSLPAGITLNSNGSFSGTATTVGASSATIRAADTHGGRVTTTLVVTVQPKPTFTAVVANTNQLVSMGGGLTALEVTKATGETLSFTLTAGALPDGISLNGLGTFSGVVTTLGVNSATIQVNDTHGGQDMTTLAVTVQAAPAFTAAAANTSQLISTGTGLAALQATAATGETLTFTVEGGSLPAGITLNGDGTFSGTATTAGSSSATIRAADTHGGRATTTLSITVQPAPAFTAAASNTSQLASVGSELAALQASKADGETLTFSLIGGSLPTGSTLNGDGSFSGTVNTVGHTTATIRVMDTHGGVDTTTLAVTVQAAPAFTAAAANTSQLISAGAGLAPLVVTKAAGETLTFSLSGGSLPAGVSLNANGIFSGAATTIGDTTATIEAIDTHGGKATTTVAVTVQPGPAFTADMSNTNQLVSVGAGLAALQATKAPSETLTFTLTGGTLPAGISLSADGIFTGTVTTVGNTVATIQAADTHGGKATTTLIVTVQPAPTFTGTATNTSQLASVGAGLAPLEVTKATGEIPTFSLTAGALPDGVTLNADGSFSGTVTTVGATSATIRVEDTHGGRATTTLAVTVQVAPAFTAAGTNMSQLISTGAGLVPIEATKATGETLVYTVTGGSLPTGISLNEDGTFSGTAATTGATSAVVQVADTHGGKATTTLSVTVQQGPAYTADAANTSQLVSVGGGLAALQVTKASGETLSFSLIGGALPAGITLDANGLFHGTVTTVGGTTATIRAADTHGGIAATTLTVTVQAAPAFTAVAWNTSQLVSVTGTPVDLQVTKAAGETLTFALISGGLPDGVLLNADGTFSGAATTVGNSTATIQVTDTHGGQAFTTVVISVQEGPAFTAALSNSSQLCSTGSGMSALSATKAAGETLTFTVIGGALPDGITLNANGTFSGTTTTVSSATVTIEALDTHGGRSTTTMAVTVQPAPAFTSTGSNTSQLVSVGAGLTDLEMTKATGETLTFTLTGGALPAGITLNADGSFTGTVSTVGSTSATLRVEDTHGGITTTTFAVTVQAAPAFTVAEANTSQLISAGAGLVPVEAIKAVGETLVYTVTGGSLPTGISLNSDGTFSGAATMVGNTTATIQTADTHGGKATTTLAVTVQPGPAYTADAANTNQLVSVGAGLAALQATKAAGETLTFTLAGGSLPAGLSLNADGTFVGAATTVGSTTATIRAADTHGGSAQTTLAVTVQAAPAFTAVQVNTSQLVSTTGTPAALEMTKAEGEILTHTLVSGALPAGISLNTDGTFAGAATTVGITTAHIQVADTHGGTAETTLSITVQRGPSYTAAPANTSQAIRWGEGLKSLESTKATGETITFALTAGTLPVGVSLNADGTFSGTAAAAGSTTATIDVTDTHGGWAATILAVSVAKLDQPAPSVPVASTIGEDYVILASDSGTLIVFNGDTKASGSTWSGLLSGHSYTDAYAYLPGDATYNPSPASATASFRTHSEASGGSLPSTPTTPTPPPPTTPENPNTPATPVTPTTPDTPNEPANGSSGLDITVNGSSERAGTVTTTTDGSTTVTTVTVDTDKLEQRLAAEGEHATTVIPVTTSADVVSCQLNGQLVQTMDRKDAILQIKTDFAIYTLPAQQIQIDNVSEQVGFPVDPKEIQVQVRIALASPEAVHIVQNPAKSSEYAVVAPPVAFTVQCTYGDRIVEVDRFNAYVERMVAIPDGVDPSKITTGVILNSDGTFSHVPTKVTVLNGRYYAVISSLTNSIYTVVWHPIEFTDMADHWAKGEVNDMGSRLVVGGVGDNLFDPDREITRAEFAAIMIRALGLRPGIGTNPFNDVEPGAWYCDSIKTASQYKIISGYGNGQFGPEDKITREQAMAIIARAMTITELGVSLTSAEAEQRLSSFVDADDVASWAGNSVALCLQAGITAGKDGQRLAPQEQITRAEMAVIVSRLLRQSGLI